MSREDDMSGTKLKAVHYLNQFFGQIGGEDKADTGFVVKEGPLGPGTALQKELGEHVEIVATLICGDNYFSKNPDRASEEGLKLIEPFAPGLFFAGPAFEAGRYGVACGAICKAVKDKLGIPAVTGMYQENPGVEMYRKYTFICRSGQSTRDMVPSIKKMSKLALRLTLGEPSKNLLSGENLPKPEEFDYFKRLIIRNEFCDQTATARSIDKLLAKIAGKPFESEVLPPVFDKVEPPAPIADLSKIELALVSDGALVPKGNPAGLAGRGNLKWTTNELDSFLPDDPGTQEYEIAHTGYFPVEVLENPFRLIPVDVLRELVKEKKIGKLHNTFFSTSGNATVSRRCAEMGNEMAEEIKSRGIDAVLLTST
jgi:betaine reductase